MICTKLSKNSLGFPNHYAQRLRLENKYRLALCCPKSSLQLVFFEEIVPAKSKAERSEITGYLTLTLHKKKYNPKVKHIAPKPQKLTKPSEQEALDDLDDLPPLI